jgi:hypothetical protein
MVKYTKRLKTLSDLRRFLASQISALDKNEITENRLRCLAYGLGVLSGIIKDSELEERLTKLEQAAAEAKS